MNAIVKIVTIYTRRGERVLLLSPPAGGMESVGGGRPLTDARHGSAGGLLPELIEAAGAVARLGRPCEARLAEPASPVPSVGTDPSADPESAHGLALGPTRTAPTGPRPTPVQETGPWGFDAVIAMVNPQATEWVPTLAWTELLAPSGVLAFITHGDYVDGRWTEPHGLLTHLARHVGLAEIDRIALLEVPIRDGALADQTPTRASQLAVAGAGIARYVRVHSDLLVFARPPAAETGTGQH
ncbi:hypothetical protein [Streptomyces sp. NPDC059479]|uniref:hypothetical protein n=1 Tax=Streptomyces sp. NPDC059479 TaxID=3346848 RepID=UPI00368EE63A